MSADRQFRVLVASYGALLLGPLPTLLVPRTPPIPALSWLVLAVGLLVGGTVGYAAGGLSSTPDRLSSVLGGSIVAILPLAYLVWLFALVANNPGKTVEHLLVRPTNAGILAFLPVMVAIHLALDADRDGARVLAEFTARPAPSVRRVRYVTMGAGLGVVVGAGLALFLAGETSQLVLGVLALTVVAITAVVFQTFERTVRLREDGIEIDGTLTQWADIDTFETDDDRLVVTLRSAWNDDVELDRSDIEPFEEVRAVLADRLSDAPT